MGLPGLGAGALVGSMSDGLAKRARWRTSSVGRARRVGGLSPRQMTGSSAVTVNSGGHGSGAGTGTGSEVVGASRVIDTLQRAIVTKNCGRGSSRMSIPWCRVKDIIEASMCRGFGKGTAGRELANHTDGARRDGRAGQATGREQSHLRVGFQGLLDMAEDL